MMIGQSLLLPGGVTLGFQEGGLPRQAEMITTIERRNRESELISLAGMHTVSMLDASFLWESQSPTLRHQGNVERLSTHASSIFTDVPGVGG